MVAIVVSIVMLIFIMLFMFSSTIGSQSGQVLKTEFRNLYSHSVLLSILRTDTSCGIFSDVLKGAYFGGGKCESESFMRSRLPGFMKALLNATGNTDYDWYLEAEPKNFQGNPMTVGNPDVLDSNERWDARTLVTWEGYQLEVKIYFMIKK
jgi:hypothetical protein